MIRLLPLITLDATTEYLVYPGVSMVVHLGAQGTLEFWNGVEWKEYPSATGALTQDKDFIFVAPVSGLIRVVIAGGQTAIVSFYPEC